METNNLRLSQCCGSCIHSSKPKIPYEHCCYYDVAKTERWCYKNNCHITRECVCDCYESITKGGAISSSKRVFAFNRRLEKILNIIQRMEKLNITEIKLFNTKGNERIILENNRLCSAYDTCLSFQNGKTNTYKTVLLGKDTCFDRYEKVINEELEELEKETK